MIPFPLTPQARQNRPFRLKLNTSVGVSLDSPQEHVVLVSSFKWQKEAMVESSNHKSESALLQHFFPYMHGHSCIIPTTRLYGLRYLVLSWLVVPFSYIFLFNGLSCMHSRFVTLNLGSRSNTFPRPRTQKITWQQHVAVLLAGQRSYISEHGIGNDFPVPTLNITE